MIPDLLPINRPRHGDHSTMVSFVMKNVNQLTPAIGTVNISGPRAALQRPAEAKMWVTQRPSRVQISEPFAPLAPPCGHYSKATSQCWSMSPVFDCSWYIKQCLFAFYLERINSVATNRFPGIIMFDKNA